MQLGKWWDPLQLEHPGVAQTDFPSWGVNVITFGMRNENRLCLQ